MEGRGKEKTEGGQNEKANCRRRKWHNLDRRLLSLLSRLKYWSVNRNVGRSKDGCLGWSVVQSVGRSVNIKVGWLVGRRMDA